MRDEAKDLPTPVEEPSSEDRRRHPRARLQLLIQLRFNTFEQFLSEYATDISVGGMFIRTDDPPRDVGSLIYLQFLLADGGKLIEGLARVVRVHAPNSDRTPGMGVEFVNLDDDSRALIEEIVAKRLSAEG